MKTNAVLLGAIALLVFLAGCTQAAQQDTAMMEKSEPVAEKEMLEGEWTPEEKAAMEKEEMEKKEAMMEGEWTPEEKAAMEKEHAETMMTSGYQDYNKELFDKAVSKHKIIVLDFAANWCPACQAEGPEIRKGLEQLNSDKVVVFKVHYKDDQTTDEHTALAQQYQIPYQHTKVVLKDGRMVAKNPKAWTAEDFITEISKFL